MAQEKANLEAARPPQIQQISVDEVAKAVTQGVLRALEAQKITGGDAALASSRLGPIVCGGRLEFIVRF